MYFCFCKRHLFTTLLRVQDLTTCAEDETLKLNRKMTAQIIRFGIVYDKSVVNCLWHDEFYQWVLSKRERSPSLSINKCKLIVFLPHARIARAKAIVCLYFGNLLVVHTHSSPSGMWDERASWEAWEVRTQSPGDRDLGFFLIWRLKHGWTWKNGCEKYAFTGRLLIFKILESHWLRMGDVVRGRSLSCRNWRHSDLPSYYKGQRWKKAATHRPHVDWPVVFFGRCWAHCTFPWESIRPPQTGKAKNCSLNHYFPPFRPKWSLRHHQPAHQCPPRTTYDYRRRRRPFLLHLILPVLEGSKKTKLMGNKKMTLYEGSLALSYLFCVL